MTPGEFIRKRRQELGISQSKLARLTRFSDWYQTTVYRIENNVSPLRFHEAVVLAKVLDFDLAELAALIPLPDVPCHVCGDLPPAGFTCNRCSARGEQ